MASLIPKFVKKEITDAWVAESWKLMLLSSSHTPNAGTQQYVSDVVANEVSDSGGVYTAGGVAIANKSSNYDTNNGYLDADDVTIGPGSTLTYRYGILYKNTGNQATSPIRAQIDFGAQSVVNGSTVIQWNALGIIYLT